MRPATSHQLERLARHVGLGLGPVGSVAHHGSGEIFTAFSTRSRHLRGCSRSHPPPDPAQLDPLFAAVVEAAEEAVLNSMFTAPSVTGRDGNTSRVRALRDRARPARDEGARRSGSRSATAPGWPRPCTSRTSRRDRSRAWWRRSPTARTTSRRRTPTGTGASARSTGTPCARIDVRGTGSSAGDAVDEYPEAEQRDLPDAFTWLAAQEWCDGQIGMWGTSYSGFNSLQIAMRAPAGAEGDLRDLRHRRPLDRRRALAGRRAAARRPGRLRPLHDRRCACCRRCRRCGATAGRTSGGAGSRPTSRGS